VVALYTSHDFAISEPGVAALAKLTEAPAFEELLAEQTRAWRHLWQECDIRIESSRASAIAMKLRLHIFHLLQTVSYHTIDLDVGVPARGWHGEAYRGHIFWDELFIFPFLILRIPILSRALLLYRYRRLPAARHAAREAGYGGAMFPWQSGSTGREESQLVHLNPRSGRWVPDVSHRQRHINAAIAHNVWRYYEATGDYDFLYFHGAELLAEIARFFASIAAYDEASERYDIRGVMGPDEFHTANPDADHVDGGGLDNNAYTNVMAAWTLVLALDVLDLLPEERRAKLCETIGLSLEELERWDHISRRLKIPFHGGGIISQFEGYERLLELDWRAARERHGDIQRLDRLLEAEGDTPNRYKVSKQADVLMLFYLFTADELSRLFERLGYPFEHETIPRNVDYYLERTSHGSTLSLVVHSWVLARAQRPRSFEMFCQALDSDIADVQGGTTPEGIHLGAMAGTVDFVQRCYTGIEASAHVLHFDPRLPEHLERLSMRLRYRRQILDVEVDHERLKVSSRRFTAAPVTIAYRGHVREISPGESYSFRLIRPHDDQRARPAKPRPPTAAAGPPQSKRTNARL
jgi:alpha,alpha-trehalase